MLLFFLSCLMTYCIQEINTLWICAELQDLDFFFSLLVCVLRHVFGSVFAFCSEFQKSIKIPFNRNGNVEACAASIHIIIFMYGDFYCHSEYKV